MAIENEDSPEGSQERIISSVLTLLSLNWYIITHKMMLVCLEGYSGVERSPTSERQIKIKKDQAKQPYEIQQIADGRKGQGRNSSQNLLSNSGLA